MRKERKSEGGGRRISRSICTLGGGGGAHARSKVALKCLLS